MKWLRRLWRELLGVDCSYCRLGMHGTCDEAWPQGCMCRIIDSHAGAMA